MSRTHEILEYFSFVLWFGGSAEDTEAEGGKRNGGTALQFPSNLFLAMACDCVP